MRRLFLDQLLQLLLEFRRRSRPVRNLLQKLKDGRSGRGTVDLLCRPFGTIVPVRFQKCPEVGISADSAACTHKAKSAIRGKCLMGSAADCARPAKPRQAEPPGCAVEHAQSAANRGSGQKGNAVIK